MEVRLSDQSVPVYVPNHKPKKLPLLGLASSGFRSRQFTIKLEINCVIQVIPCLELLNVDQAADTADMYVQHKQQGGGSLILSFDSLKGLP